MPYQIKWNWFSPTTENLIFAHAFSITCVEPYRCGHLENQCTEHRIHIYIHIDRNAYTNVICGHGDYRIRSLPVCIRSYGRLECFESNKLSIFVFGSKNDHIKPFHIAMCSNFVWLCVCVCVLKIDQKAINFFLLSVCCRFKFQFIYLGLRPWKNTINQISNVHTHSHRLVRVFVVRWYTSC